MSDAELRRDKQIMLRRHLQGRGIFDRRVLDAMARVPREKFVDESLQADAYADRRCRSPAGRRSANRT